MTESVHQFETGAVRSTDADDVRYDLISPIALDEIARTYAEGSAKYGDHNWLKGMPVSDLLNHAIRHAYMFLSGDRSEPHLAHAAWGLMAAIHSHKQSPYLNGNLHGPGCTPPSAGPTPPSDEAKATVRADAGHEACAGPHGCIAPPICEEWGCELRTSSCAAPAKRKPHRIPRLNDPRDGSVPPPVLYLSGPMTGFADFNFPAFNNAAEKLRRKGWPVLNPADFGCAEKDWAANLKRDLMVMSYAEILVQLPGWQDSRGASLEYSTAVSLGMGVIGLDEMLNV